MKQIVPPSSGRETLWQRRAAKSFRKFWSKHIDSVRRRNETRRVSLIPAPSQSDTPAEREQEESGNEELARQLAERLQILYGYQVGLYDLIPAILDELSNWKFPVGGATKETKTDEKD